MNINRYYTLKLAKSVNKFHYEIYNYTECKSQTIDTHNTGLPYEPYGVYLLFFQQKISENICRFQYALCKCIWQLPIREPAVKFSVQQLFPFVGLLNASCFLGPNCISHISFGKLQSLNLKKNKMDRMSSSSPHGKSKKFQPFSHNLFLLRTRICWSFGMKHKFSV